MPEYLSPGVYVEEIDSGPKPIEGVGTATAAFIGFTEKAQRARRVNGDLVVEDLLNRPELVTNWTQFGECYGGFVDGAYLPHAVYGYFENGGTRCYVVSLATLPKAQAPLLNSEGQPRLVARARHGGLEGERLRVKVDAPPAQVTVAPQPRTRAKAKEGDAAEAEQGSAGPETASAAAVPAPFTITVERQGVTGGWQVEEAMREVTLTEATREDGSREVYVTYPYNRTPRWIELVVPDTQESLAKLWPQTQEQALRVDRGLLPAPTSADFRGDVSQRKGLEGLEAIDDITMLCVPDLMAVAPGQKLNQDMVRSVQNAMIAHCERMKDRVAILDAPPNMSPQEVRAWRMGTAGTASYDSSYAAFYYPWIRVLDPIRGQPICIPPSGHVAGIWARSDNTRGVHKAPANEGVRYADSLAVNVTKGEQDILNPIGVNCIRAFPGMGIRVWGARTLSNNPAWRYINVRRLFNYVEKSIERGTQWIVFEPNDRLLWAKVRRDVTSFLRMLWLGGALFGNTPEEAFYVKCDDALNPREVRDQGQLIIEIGLAPVKPAEFVIFRIAQWAGPNAEA